NLSHGERSLPFTFLHFGNGVVAGASSECHVGERRIHTRGGSHASAVGDEEIADVVSLIVGVEYGSFGIATHASGAHFVDAAAGRSDGLVDGDFAGTGSGEHLRGLKSDVA